MNMETLQSYLDRLDALAPPPFADALGFDPPYVDDPDWLIGRVVQYNRRLYRVESVKDAWCETWAHLIPLTGFLDKWALVDDCSIEIGRVTVEPKPAFVQILEQWLADYDTRHSLHYGGAICERLDKTDALRAKVYLNQRGGFTASLTEDGRLIVYRAS